MIDLRSDTVTLPTAAMRRAMAEADVGDEQRREDPTVIALEERVATMLGQEAAVFLPSATMANQIAIRLLTEPGDEIVAHATSHIVLNELAGAAVHSGVATKPIASADGRLDAQEVREASTAGNLHQAPTRLLCVENTHANAGGRTWSVDDAREVVAAARSAGLATHLDGARLLNATIARQLAPKVYGALFDTVTLCLSKGLGCPLGALLAGSRERMAIARRLKHLFGGALRQAGIVAAAGLYALDHHVERLADDHAHALRLATGLRDAGLPVETDHVETNFVMIDAGRLGLQTGPALARCQAAGAGLSATATTGVLRAVTHLGVGPGSIDEAIEAIRAALTR